LSILPALVGSASAAAGVSSVSGGAYALSANVNVVLVPLSIGALPEVSLPPEGGGPYAQSLLSTNVLGLTPVGMARVSTRGNSGIGWARSSAAVADLGVAGLVETSAAASECSATADGADASATVADLRVAGIAISTLAAGPNTTITLPIGRVIVNEQRKEAGGITVNAVHVLLDAALASGDVVISHARCAVHASTSTRRRTGRLHHAQRAARS
jgi:hypothetical protein